MSVIEAASVRVQTMADGTLRLVCDIEPRNAQAAFALFASPGTPMALAALKPQTSKPKAEVGELCKWAAIRCTEPEFRRWCGVANEQDAAEFVRRVCHVESRTELDTNPEAAELLHSTVRRPYAAWLKKQTVPT